MHQPVNCPHCGIKTNVDRNNINRLKTNLISGALVLCGVCQGPIVVVENRLPTLVTTDYLRKNRGRR